MSFRLFRVLTGLWFAFVALLQLSVIGGIGYVIYLLLLHFGVIA